MHCIRLSIAALKFTLDYVRMPVYYSFLTLYTETTAHLFFLLPPCMFFLGEICFLMLLALSVTLQWLGFSDFIWIFSFIVYSTNKTLNLHAHVQRFLRESKFSFFISMFWNSFFLSDTCRPRICYITSVFFCITAGTHCLDAQAHAHTISFYC